MTDRAADSRTFDSEPVNSSTDTPSPDHALAERYAAVPGDKSQPSSRSTKGSSQSMKISASSKKQRKQRSTSLRIATVVKGVQSLELAGEAGSSSDNSSRSDILTQRPLQPSNMAVSMVGPNGESSNCRNESSSLTSDGKMSTAEQSPYGTLPTANPPNCSDRGSVDSKSIKPRKSSRAKPAAPGRASQHRGPDSQSSDLLPTDVIIESGVISSQQGSKPSPRLAPHTNEMPSTAVLLPAILSPASGANPSVNPAGKSKKSRNPLPVTDAVDSATTNDSLTGMDTNQNRPLRKSSSYTGTPVNQLSAVESTTYTPLPFHYCIGRNIALTEERTVASRLPDEYCNGYVFTSRNIRPGEKLAIRVLSVDADYIGGIAFGMTACDPSKIRAALLPDDPNLLLDLEHYWVVHKNINTKPKVDDELIFHVTDEGL